MKRQAHVLQVEQTGEITVPTVDVLLIHYKYVGFIPDDDPQWRYMMGRFGGVRGLAIRATCNYASKNEQKTVEGKYFVFDSAAELYHWMAEGVE